ncbi:MAG: histidine kinase, partial [Actinomycetota bacterium]|nr:histidine kinase [Actinomycetota bacterium]
MQKVRRPAVADTLLATLLAVAALTELAWADEPVTAFRVAVALGSTLPLATRRQYPLGVVAAVMVALTALTVQSSDFITFAQLLAMLVATYSVAAHSSRPRAVAGLVLANAAGLANGLLLPNPEVGDYLFPVLLLTGPWIAGRALRLWRQRNVELDELNRRLEQEQAERETFAAATERARIARELHDILAQSINIIVIHAEAAEQALGHDPALARAPLNRIQDTGREALQATRSMLGVLRHDGQRRHDPTPRVAHLDALADRVRAAGLQVQLTIEGSARPLPSALDLSAYRIIEESLTNTLKHARAGAVSV